MNQARIENHLAIGGGGKGIPYGAGDRPDGGRNHGYRFLKGHIERLAEIPEAVGDTALWNALEMLNDAATAVFTIGCGSGPVAAAEGYRKTGYLEFALDDRSAITSAAAYFPVFFNFDKLCKRQDPDYAKAYLLWELEGATFLDAGCVGFTCTVFVNTHVYATQEEADTCWDHCLSLLSSYLLHVPPVDDPQRRVYQPDP